MPPIWRCGVDAKRTKAGDVWRERIVAQQGSGQSVRAWCREHGCPEHGFYWWRARLGLSPTSGVKQRRVRRPSPAGFAEVIVGRSAEAMTLRLGGGRELLLPAAMPVEQVARLVHAIEARA
jgi:transposase-like protein